MISSNFNLLLFIYLLSVLYIIIFMVQQNYFQVCIKLKLFKYFNKTGLFHAEVGKACNNQTIALTIAALQTDQSTFTRTVTQHYVYHHDDLASFDSRQNSSLGQ